MLYDVTTLQSKEIMDATAGWPAWSRDGQYAGFVRLPGPSYSRYRVSDGKIETTPFKTWHPAPDSLGWVGLGPDGSILTVLDGSVTGIFALELAQEHHTLLTRTFKCKLNWVKAFAPTMLACALAAQDPQYEVQSRLVLVPVSVTNAQGRTVDGLESQDFIVFDNGRRQKATVDTIGTGVAPIALVVAIQTSGISKPVLEKVRKIGAMVQPIVTGESGCAAVMSFSDRITWIQECTGSAGLLERAFQQVRPEAPKTARMLDAVQASVDRLRQRPNARRVLLLISETRDRGSDLKLEQIAQAVEAQGVTVYAATYSAFATAFTTRSSATGDPQAPKIPKTPNEQTGTLDGGPPHCTPAGCPSPPVPLADQRVDLLGTFGELARLGKTNTTQVLTKITGGVTFPFTRLKGLEDAIEKLGEELHSQYVLSFTPDDRRGGYHTLEVRVARHDLRIRARPGYWSTQAAH